MQKTMQPLQYSYNNRKSEMLHIPLLGVGLVLLLFLASPGSSCKEEEKTSLLESQISCKIFGRCPKVTPNTSGLAKLKYPSQLVTRVLRSILWNGTIPTQQMKSDLELR